MQNRFGDTVEEPTNRFGDTVPQTVVQPQAAVVPGPVFIGPAEDQARIDSPPPPSNIVDRNSVESLLGSFGIGANRGIANVVGAPVDLAAAGLRAAGVPATAPVGGSQSIENLLQSLGFESTPEGFQSLAGREQTGPERITGRVGEEVAAGAVAGAPVLGLAARPARVAATTTAGGIGQSIVAPARTAPLATAGIDLATSVASGTGAGVARELAPGNVNAELAGQFAPIALPALLAGSVRMLARGGDAGQTSLQATIDDFAKAGTTPSVGQGTGNVIAEGAESTLGRLPGGVGTTFRFGQRQSQAIGDTINRMVASLARNADPEQAGRLIERGLISGDDSFVGRFQDVSEKLFDDLDQFIPGDTLVPASNSQAALNALSSPVAGAENLSEALLINPSIRRAAEAFAADVGQTGTLPYETLKNVRSSIGRMLSSPSAIDDLPRAQLRRVYAALSDDMAAAAAQNGGTRAFERANRYYRAGLNRIENVIEPLVRNRVPERIFTALERSGRDGATTVRTIYRSLKPEEQATVTGLVLRRLGQSTPGRQGAEGLEFSTETFLTNWNRLAPDTKSVLFAQPHFGPLRGDLDSIARATQAIREGSQVIANPSGTGAAAAQATGVALTGAGAFQAAQGQFGLLGTVMTTMATANIGSRLMTSPKFVRWLAQTTALSPAALPAHIGRLTTTLQDADAETAEETVRLIRALSEEPR